MSDVNYSDIHIQGQLSDNGEIITYIGKQAVENAIRFWLVSFPNDYLRSPGRGGFLTGFLSKPMDDNNAQDIRDSIYVGFSRDFRPKVELTELTVTPLYNIRTWQISVKGFCPAVQDSVSIEVFMRSKL